MNGGLGRVEKATKHATMAGALAAGLLAIAHAATVPSWPSEKYRNDPVAFFREVLGIEPWDRQLEVIEAIRDHDRVSVRAGQKVSKTNTVVGAALWFYCSYEPALVQMTSVTARQVNTILWRELKFEVARSGRCAECRARDFTGFSRCERCSPAPLIDGDLSEVPATGLRTAGERRKISGFTAKEAEAVQGVSGNVLWIIDEASGVPEPIFEAIEGNCAGGGKILLTGNPTKIEGTFFRSHNEGKEAWHCIHIPSTDSPNVREGRTVIPGLATRHWVELQASNYGEDSAWYYARVKGEFPIADSTKVVPMYLINEAHERWEDFLYQHRELGKEYEGRLQVGVDPASTGDDESICILRRGDMVLGAPRAWRGLDEKRVAAEVMQVIRAELAERAKRRGRPETQKPLLKFDKCGTVGTDFYAAIREYKDEIDIVPVDASLPSSRKSEYRTLRDEIWFGVAMWLREGGAIPPEKKLDVELMTPSYEFDDRQRRIVENKDDLKKRIRRSPDRADALALCVYEPHQVRAEDYLQGPAAPSRDGEQRAFDPYAASRQMNPYAASRAFGRRS
ncbi:hypothetical protein WMF20_35435 [Sorangium sp. So ce834]|uniref:hypothetical protein n=1 Tax=Sorangium sp. So ce834 TaxID=3133321 RepID=UPI003F5F6A15